LFAPEYQTLEIKKPELFQLRLILLHTVLLHYIHGLFQKI